MRWQEVLISPLTPVLEAIKVIDAGALQIALVVDEKRRLLGTVTDGDVRRGLLRGLAMGEKVLHIMNAYPVSVQVSEGREHTYAVMKQKRLRHMPIVDENGRVVAVETLDSISEPVRMDNWVVLMAGGMGNRLRPLTDDCPKPLLQVGKKPILETVLDNFKEYGFYKFYISVHYRAEMIEDYFGDGGKWNVEIDYLRENRKMGTAGALSLLPAKPDRPLLVMNGDLLTKVNFHHLLNFHKENYAQATMCVREYDIQVPYGVVQINRHRLTSIEEKPVQRYFVNAGIYVLEPESLQAIPENVHLDMPVLFNKLIEQRQEIAVFPVREYWLDVGRVVDYEKADGDYQNVFAKY